MKGIIIFPRPSSLELLFIVVGKLLGMIENISPRSNTRAELALRPGCQGLCQIFVIALT